MLRYLILILFSIKNIFNQIHYYEKKKKKGKVSLSKRNCIP